MKDSSKRSELLFPEAAQKSPGMYFEKKWRQRGYKIIAGVDEAGRGPLAGPVVAAAVILPEKISDDSMLWEIKDSKLLKSSERENLFSLIKEKAVDYAVAECSAGEIDELNILQASLTAMTKAVLALKVRPDICLVDGNKPIEADMPSSAVIKGDRYCLSIAAASIVAKVTRDRIMDNYHETWPAYNFTKNKGYSTKEHIQAIRDQGPCSIHRKTFRQVKPMD